MDGSSGTIVRWYEYTGTTPAEMEGWGWQSVHDPAVLPGVLERWKGAIATGEPFEMVFPLRGADRVFRPFLTRVQPLKDEQGRVTRWFGTNTDISEQQRIADNLAAEKRHLETLNQTIARVSAELDLEAAGSERDRRRCEPHGRSVRRVLLQCH